MSAGPIAPQSFEPVTRRYPQIVEPLRRRQHDEFALRTTLDVRR